MVGETRITYCQVRGNMSRISNSSVRSDGQNPGTKGIRNACRSSKPLHQTGWRERLPTATPAFSCFACMYLQSDGRTHPVTQQRHNTRAASLVRQALRSGYRVSLLATETMAEGYMKKRSRGSSGTREGRGLAGCCETTGYSSGCGQRNSSK